MEMVFATVFVILNWELVKQQILLCQVFVVAHALIILVATMILVLASAIHLTQLDQIIAVELAQV